MMIWDRMGVLRALFPARRAAAPVAARWAEAAEREPALLADVIRLGGLLAAPPVRFVDGLPVSTTWAEPVDPIALARAEGRRTLALELGAMMGLDAFQLSTLMTEETTRDD